MSNPLVIYHGTCMDGAAAAWAAWKKYGDDAEYVPAVYGSEPPDVADREVLIVDFSYPRDALVRMAAEARSLVVLDHHKTAREALEGLPFCTFDMDRSGAGLAWDVLHGSARPWLVDYVEDRDLWRFALPDSTDVNAYIQTADYSVAAMDRIWREGFEKARDSGRVASAVRRSYIDSTKRLARPCVLGNHPPVPCVNAPYWSVSEVAGELAVGALFAFAWHRGADGRWNYSLRSKGDFDVSELAKMYGGGGHRNAAGFSTLDPVHADAGGTQ